MSVIAGHVYDCECLSCLITMSGKSLYSPASLVMASDQGDLNLVRMIIAHGVYDNHPSLANDYSALMAASSESYHNIVEELLRIGSNPNAMTIDKGFTPLMYASEMGAYSIARMLLLAGADPNAVAKDGSTAWDMASANYHTDILRLLEEFCR